MFDPYCFNGELGSVVAIAGKDYAVIGSDTRLAKYMALLSRSQVKLFPLGERHILGVVGVQADILGFTGAARTHMLKYEVTQERPLQLQSMAHMLGMVLRDSPLPYYVYAVLAGLDEEGRGCVFSYAPFRPTSQTSFCVVGSAANFIQPILDNQINAGHAPKFQASLPLASAMSLMQDVFGVAGERDVFTGDSLRVSAITREGVEETSYPLRKD